MADNFNLRAFLSENKLTKNAQLLNELDLADVPEAIDLPGVTGDVTVVFYSEHGMSEAEIEVMSVQEALALIRDDAAGDETEDVIINTSDIDQQGDLHPETKGLKCVLEVAILNHGTYEVYQGSNKGSNAIKEQEDYKYFDEEGTRGFYMTTIDGVQIYSLEDSSVADTCFYALVEPETTYMISIDVSGEPVDADYVEQDSGVTGKVAEFIANDINKELGQEGGEDVNEAQYSDSYDTPAAKKVHGQLTDIVDIFEKSRDQETQELNAAIDAAEKQTGTQVTPTERRVLQQQASWIRTRRSEMERESVDNKKPIMKETKLTAKERRLVEMVNNAMREDHGYATHDGSFGGDDSEEENVDYTMGRQNDPNQLPNPAPELNIPEGEDMVQEKPMPKYESIDQLMKEIEHGTNEAAHKYKMEEMKRIYELLETKVTSLEEGENAEHIDQSKVKQMRKDIAALRKAEEKLRKEFEKKFTGKEKKEAPKKVEKQAATEAASEALQEGTFDLRKFLVENRK